MLHHTAKGKGFGVCPSESCGREKKKDGSQERARKSGDKIDLLVGNTAIQSNAK